MLTLWLAGIVVLVGAFVQGAAGYGLNVLAGSLLALIDPSFIPVPTLMLAAVPAALAVIREWEHVRWREIRWAMAGRVVGNLLGIGIFLLLPERQVSLFLGVVILLLVGMSVIKLDIQVTPRNLVIAGVASGASGTSATIGGPPIGLVYQNQSGPTVRSNLGLFFVFGSFSSLALLALAGKVHTHHWIQAAELLPFLAAGWLLSYPLRRYLDAGKVKGAILTIAAVAAVVLIGRTLL
ncbi:sulfite exporter TauE/SafE family protein [Pseudonocardiaceae bacterium YIM PH 21723]|nr:sulfite exporter TauE/SafE family protein [Pseudonocardiaceae bacterium YIM PH 21723]